jgi:hypothetical protein
VDTQSNCATQLTPGSSQTFTVAYLQDGAPAANKNIVFYNTTNSSATFAQGPGTPGNNGGVTPSAGTESTDCVTNAQGQCSVTVNTDANATGSAVILASTVTYANNTSNVAPYPDSAAEETIHYIPSTTPTTLGLISQTVLYPAGGYTPSNPQSTSSNNEPPQPGDAVEQTYQLTGGCTPTGGSPANNACTGTGLAGITVNLSVDHGFFTPNCVPQGTAGAANTPSNTGTPPTGATYENCTFNPTPTVGAQVGNLQSNGATTTATTNPGGYFTVTLGIGRDTALDATGLVVTTVKGSVGSGSSLTETNEAVNNNNPPAPNSFYVPSSGPGSCTTPATTNNTDAGCPTNFEWSTQNTPLNGGSVKIVSVPNSSTEAPLSDTATNNIPNESANNSTDISERTFVLHETDQFGNLIQDGGGSTTLTLTGTGEVGSCDNPGGYSNTATCQNQDSGAFSQPSGVNTYTVTPAAASYTTAFGPGGAPLQQRYYVDSDGNTGTATLTATWAAPVTTFATYTAPTSSGTPGAATYNRTTSNKTDVVALNFYNQVATTVTFNTVPSNTVPAGTLVTVEATVKDQFGNPIVGDTAHFTRSGPNPNNGTDCTATTSDPNSPATDSTGTAGWSFTCNTPGTQTVQVIVTDQSGNRVGQPGVQTVTFTNGTVTSPTPTPTSTSTTPPPGNKSTLPAFRNGSTVILGTLAGAGAQSIPFGNSTDQTVWGDWNGDGTPTIGVFRASTGMWYLTNDNHTVAYTFRFGQKGDIALAGDWNGNGTTSIGVYRPSTQTFFLSNGLTGHIDAKAKFGNPGDEPLVGDWDGSGITKIGVYRPSNATFYRINHDGLRFGSKGDHAVVGDWDGNKTTTIGVIRGTTWLLSNDNHSVAVTVSNFGNPATDFTYSNGVSAGATVDS